jgi:hypothetical protein
VVAFRRLVPLYRMRVSTPRVYRVKRGDAHELLTFLIISVANIVRIARVMLPNPIEREIVSLVETIIC